MNCMIRIGSDESLKGDTFGGIVVAAVKSDDTVRERLERIGVADSKKITDKKIKELAPKIKELVGTSGYCIRSKMPFEYNREPKQTIILNNMHSQAVGFLKPADEIVVDRFPGSRIIGAKLVEKAESKYVEVAAASILARDEAIKQMDKLSENIGFDIPYGSTHVKEALEKLKGSGKDPSRFVKRHFRNVKVFFG